MVGFTTLHRPYWLDIQNSLDQHAATYAKEIFANAQIINLIEKLAQPPIAISEISSAKKARRQLLGWSAKLAVESCIYTIP